MAGAEHRRRGREEQHGERDRGRRMERWRGQVGGRRSPAHVNWGDGHVLGAMDPAPLQAIVDSLGWVADRLLDPARRQLDRDEVSLVVSLEAARLRGLVVRGWGSRLGGALPYTAVSELVHAVEVLVGQRVADRSVSFRTNLVTPLPWAVAVPFEVALDLVCESVEDGLRAARSGAVTLSVEYDLRERVLRMLVADSRAIETGGRRSVMDNSVSVNLAERIDRLGGALSVERSPGRGCVRVLTLPAEPIGTVMRDAETGGYLPRLRAIPRTATRRSVRRIQSKRPRWALIVEPNVVARMNIVRLVRANGFAAIGLSTAAPVPAFVAERAADLLIVDLEDNALHSSSWWGELERSRFQGAIIGTTAHTGPVSPELGRRIHPVLRKPIVRSELESAIRRSDRAVIRSASQSESPSRVADGEMASLVGQYLTELPHVVQAIASARERGEIGAVRDDLHRLRAAALFGYPAVSDLARTIERDIAESRSADFESHLSALARLVNTLATLPRSGPQVK